MITCHPTCPNWPLPHDIGITQRAGLGPAVPGAAQTHANIQQSSEFRKRASGIGAGIQQTAQNLLKLQQLIKRTGIQPLMFRIGCSSCAALFNVVSSLLMNDVSLP